ncbi:glycosyltransferase family 4 protein [Levilinea saccharolytica]|uniref:glycosyltransferase family 4 protein n=1 Tax=Levilinea saccharolytica TaxID=229921 RepID=UPI0009E245F4|nr:glycosyltransferase family 4 protein [Levilinea saccharolytica]GAP18816.1 glycosyltransferase [Levilinea saccharolytica]
MVENSSSKIKIAVFTNQFPGKVNTFFARDIVALMQGGFDVDIFPVYPIKKEYWEFVPQKYQDILKESAGLVYQPPYPIRGIPTYLRKDVSQILRDSSRFGLSQWGKSYYVIQQALNWAKCVENKYQIFLSFWGNYAATYAYLAKKASRSQAPFSFYLHAGTDLYRDQIFLEQKILAASVVLSVCEFNKKFLQTLYPQSYPFFEERVLIHHLGVNLKDLSFCPDGRQETTILAVGSLFPAKGFHLLIKAFAQVVERLPNLVLILIGEGPERKRIDHLICKLGVKEKVILLGHLPFDQVIGYMRNSTILVHPSLGLGDAVPTVIKESLALGLPVIASDVAGIPELLNHGECGVLVPSGDVNALSKAILKLMTDESLRLEYAHTGREWACQMFDLEKTGKRLSQILQQTVK